MKIRVGSRESKLAVMQSNIVIEAIKKYAAKNNLNIEIELVTMKTTGDIILDKTLDKIGGKGLFVKELDNALIENKIDIAVHSYKDMPMDISNELPIVATSVREIPNDVLILPKGVSEIDFKKPIGCSSARRTFQLKRIYENVLVKPVRGNVLTRLEKLDSGEFSALVLAYAGIKRLGLEDRISRVFETFEMVPSACQGIIAVQARAGYETPFLEYFHDETSKIVSTAERSFIKSLNGDCSSPIGSFATVNCDEITLNCFYANDEGETVISNHCGNFDDAKIIGETLANTVKEKFGC